MKIFVEDLKSGDQITDQVFSIDEIQQHTTRTNKPYYRLILQDRTGEIVAKIWENDFENCNFRGLSRGDIVSVDGSISEYKGSLQFIIRKLVKAKDYDISDLVQSTSRDLDKMLVELMDIVNNLQNKDLKKLLKNIFEDKEFVNRYKRTPAAEKVHHDFVGGLLEHTLEMIEIAKAMFKYYPEADKDITIAGCILHDIGKVYELKVENTAMVRTLEGKLIGHIAQGIEFVLSKKPKGFPDKLWLKIKHIILSHQHQTDREYGSPIGQATIEAAIVHVADYASSRVRQFQKAINLGEGMDEGFSDYQKWIGTKVYLD